MTTALTVNRPLPVIRAWLDRVDASLKTWARRWRPPVELDDAIRELRAELKAAREEWVQHAAQELLEATEDDDRDRIAARVYAGIRLVLPWEAEGPIGVLGESLVATAIAIDVRWVMRMAHGVATKRLEELEDLAAAETMQPDEAPQA